MKITACIHGKIFSKCLAVCHGILVFSDQLCSSPVGQDIIRRLCLLYRSSRASVKPIHRILIFARRRLAIPARDRTVPAHSVLDRALVLLRAYLASERSFPACSYILFHCHSAQKQAPVTSCKNQYGLCFFMEFLILQQALRLIHQQHCHHIYVRSSVPLLP